MFIFCYGKSIGGSEVLKLPPGNIQIKLHLNSLQIGAYPQHSHAEGAKLQKHVSHKAYIQEKQAFFVARHKPAAFLHGGCNPAGGIFQENIEGLPVKKQNREIPDYSQEYKGKQCQKLPGCAFQKRR